MMSKSIRTQCVGVAFYVGILHGVQVDLEWILHDDEVDSDTVRGRGLLL
jgi:hypothetical protein